jgi:hypothetical protein
MKKIVNAFISSLTIVLTLFACSPQREQVSSTATKMVEVSRTPTIQPPKSSPTSTASATQVIPQEVHATETDFPKHTKTVTPKMTPSPTSEVTFLELPSWVKNPSSQIMLFIYDPYPTTRSSEIGFFNAASGEQAIIRLPFEIYQYYWKDANHIVFLQGYCADPIERVTELDISLGILSPAIAENLPRNIAYCYGLEDTSATVKIDATSSEPTVRIIDPLSGAWLQVSDPSDGISDIHFSLSPNHDYLGIVQIQGNYDFPELWQPLYGTQVSVYHLPDRKLVASFADETAVSELLLFTDNETLVYVSFHTPCVISIATASKKCIYAIPYRFPGSAIILGDPLKDRQKMSFLYFSHSPHQGGWCIYDLFSGGLNCPTDEFEDLQGQTVVNYAISPDNNYLLIEYDSKGCPSPWCDYFARIQTAVIDIAGKKFYKLGDSSTYETMDIFRDTQPWRPEP